MTRDRSGFHLFALLVPFAIIITFCDVSFNSPPPPTPTYRQTHCLFLRWVSLWYYSDYGHCFVESWLKTRMGGEDPQTVILLSTFGWMFNYFAYWFYFCQSALITWILSSLPTHLSDLHRASILITHSVHNIFFFSLKLHPLWFLMYSLMLLTLFVFWALCWFNVPPPPLHYSGQQMKWQLKTKGTFQKCFLLQIFSPPLERHKTALHVWAKCNNLFQIKILSQ